MNRFEPVVANWLVRRFRGEDGKSLAGDLAEQYSRGRSRFWYWRQTLAVIPVGTVTAFRNDRLLPLRAILAGLTTKIAWTWVFRTFSNQPIAHWRLPEGTVIPLLILAFSGAGAARNLFFPRSVPVAVITRNPHGGPRQGESGPMVLCWAAAWLLWTAAYSMFMNTGWVPGQALMQTLSILAGGFAVPLNFRRDDQKPIKLGL